MYFDIGASGNSGGSERTIPHGFRHINADRPAMWASMTSCDEEISARAASNIKNGFPGHNGRDQMRVSDPGERRRAIGGQRSKLGGIIAEECNRVRRTAMEVKISVGSEATR